jgi:hypothetical protein
LPTRGENGKTVNFLLFKSEDIIWCPQAEKAGNASKGVWMAVVYRLMGGIVKGIPVLLAKVGTILLFVFTLGMLAGYFFAVMGYNQLILLVPIVSMVVMWQKLDEGALAFIALMAMAFFFPEFFMV